MSTSPVDNSAGESKASPRPMSSLTTVEITRIATELQTLVGSQLQDVYMAESGELGLGIYAHGRTTWLWFDLHPQRPLVLRLPKPPHGVKKATRPILLFLKSRFAGRRLERVMADVGRGRILLFEFARGKDEGVEEPCILEVRLFPHGQNLIARDGKSQIAQIKPKELPEHLPSQNFEDEGRSWEEIEDAWKAMRERGKSNARQSTTPSASASASAPALDRAERDWKKAIDKKEKALERMKLELEEKLSPKFSQLGEWLKLHGTLEVPQEWKDLINSEQTLFWNIEEVFRRSKENRRKAEGTRARIETVAQELQDLKARGPKKHAVQTAKSDSNESLLVRAEAKGRRHKIADDIEVYVGKSAADNLALLRRAQSFDYWLHLRERPGSHAILRRARSRVVSDAELIEAGRWVVEQSTGKRAAELKGDRFDLLIVECRFVRPIKGDKLGRVNYTNDRVMTLRF